MFDLSSKPIYPARNRCPGGCVGLRGDLPASYCYLRACKFLEALADHVATLLLAEFDISGLRMTISKPGAVSEADGVGVVIARLDTKRSLR